MTLFLIICALMAIIGGAIVGWFVRWNSVEVGEHVLPHQLERNKTQNGSV